MAVTQKGKVKKRDHAAPALTKAKKVAGIRGGAAMLTTSADTAASMTDMAGVVRMEQPKRTVRTQITAF